MNTVIVFGASGDLAKKKTFPALFGLFLHSSLPRPFILIGYARTAMSTNEFTSKLRPFMRRPASLSEEAFEMKWKEFVQRIVYIFGGYDVDEDFEVLCNSLSALEDSCCETENGTSIARAIGNPPQLRLFYLALPPSVFIPVSQRIHKYLFNAALINRIVVEKPFGRDLESSNALSSALNPLFAENQLYRIDHYLGKEMVKNIVILRFANIFFQHVWCSACVSNIQITFKEPFGTEGRGGYFDSYGIIRDVMQNHLMQILCLIAMEKPANLNAESVRDAKVKVLECIEPLKVDDVLIGQYVAANGKPGYLDDSTVPPSSTTATFAAAIFQVRNDRWKETPFILKCGKALNEQKAEIRVQFKDVPNSLFPTSQLARNELVIRLQPNEAVYLKLMVKNPGLGSETAVSELDLSYSQRYSHVRIPEAYESLLLDALNGDQSNFVRGDELEAAWRIFTPLLHQLETEKVRPLDYEYGSRGPMGLDEWIAKRGYVRSEKPYIWNSSWRK